MTLIQTKQKRAGREQRNKYKPRTETSTKQEQTQEQHLTIRHAGRPADSLVRMVPTLEVLIQGLCKAYVTHGQIRILEVLRYHPNNMAKPRPSRTRLGLLGGLQHAPALCCRMEALGEGWDGCWRYGIKVLSHLHHKLLDMYIYIYIDR